jgi:DNA mismatch repair protein MutS2
VAAQGRGGRRRAGRRGFSLGMPRCGRRLETTMDTHTLELLEFDKVRSLVSARAASPLGKTAAREIQPSVDLGEIRHRQALTTEMAEALAAGLRPPLGGLHDIRPLVRRTVVGGTLAAEELAETAETLRAIGNLDRWFARIGDQFPRLGGMREGVGEFSALAAAIEGCLDPRGKVLDTASRRLSGLRRQIGQTEEIIHAELRQMLRSVEVRRALRYPNFTMVGHHYVLPVAKEHRGEIQGAVHRTSASNETVYVEPTAIGEKTARLSFLRVREEKEVRRILRWLSAQLGMVSGSLLGTLETMAGLDLVFARARFSLDYEMTAPHFNEEGILVLGGARHPLLEAIFRGEPVLAKRAPSQVAAPSSGDSPPAPAVGSILAETAAPAGGSADQDAGAGEARVVVPIDVNLGSPFHILVVTGPNTGGKTVALKTVGLLALMAQSGMHIPAREGSQLPLFDDVLADIGDEQSLEQSLSTFSSHVRRMAEILRKATNRSLVLLDEMGAGTDPTDGAALGRAILDELDRIGSSAIVTTHIGDLKTYALSNPGAENAAVEFDDETLRPKYRLRIGDIGESNALKIARHLRLADHVIARAEAYLSDRRAAVIPEWEAVQKLRKEAEEARQAALAAQLEAQRAREALAQRLAEVQRETERADSLAESRARLQPGDRVVVARLGYDRPGRLVKLDLRKKTAVVAIGHVTWDVDIDELIPQMIRTASGAGPSRATAPPKSALKAPAIPPEGPEEE